MIQIQKNFLASNDVLLNLEHSANQVLILCVLLYYYKPQNSGFFRKILLRQLIS